MTEDVMERALNIYRKLRGCEPGSDCEGCVCRERFEQSLRALTAAGLAVISRKITDEQARQFAKASPYITDVGQARSCYTAALAAGELRPSSGDPS